MKLVKSTPQISVFYRFEQIVDAVDAERVDGVLVVGRGEYDRSGYLCLLEDGKGRIIAQMDIHHD